MIQVAEDGADQGPGVRSSRALELDQERDPTAHAVDDLRQAGDVLIASEQPGVRQVARCQRHGGPGQARRPAEVEVGQDDQLAAIGQLYIKLTGIASRGRGLERRQRVLRQAPPKSYRPRWAIGLEVSQAGRGRATTVSW